MSGYAEVLRVIRELIVRAGSAQDEVARPGEESCE
jgi:hypothetical protein